MNITDVLIVGLGVMGGSYAVALKKQGCRITAIDRDGEAIAWALENGLIDKGIVTGPVDSSLSAQNVGELRTVLGQADHIVLGLYPERILPWLRVYRSLLKPGVIVADMAAVKGNFLLQAQQMMPTGCEFVGCHPMAGMERVGVKYANDSLFSTSNFIVVPTEHNTEAGLQFAHSLAQTMGFMKVVELGLEDHDYLVGYVSQLTHIVAVCLMNASDDPRLADATGTTFRRYIRNVGVNEALWSELMFANAPVLAQQISLLIDRLVEMRRRLTNNDHEGVKELLDDATQHRRRFEHRRRER